MSLSTCSPRGARRRRKWACSPRTRPGRWEGVGPDHRHAPACPPSRSSPGGWGEELVPALSPLHALEELEPMGDTLHAPGPVGRHG